MSKKRETMAYEDVWNELCAQEEKDKNTDYFCGEYGMRLCSYDALAEEWEVVTEPCEKVKTKLKLIVNTIQS